MTGAVRLDRIESPYPPLVADSAGLNRYPEAPQRLRARMAAVYGVGSEQVLPVRGATHGLELLMRRARLDGATTLATLAPAPEPCRRLAAVYGLRLQEVAELTVLRDCGAALVLLAPPTEAPGALPSADEILELAAALPNAMIAVDESWIEFTDAPGAAELLPRAPHLVILRSLSVAYAMSGARCGALIAAPDLIARVEDVLEPYALPVPTIRAAEAALAPSRALVTERRIAAITAERARMVEYLAASPAVAAVAPGAGPFLFVTPRDPAATARRLAALGLEVHQTAEGLRASVGAPEDNDLLLEALGATAPVAPRRRGEAFRDTKETRIVAAVDLDRPGDIRIDTGVGFFDHMLQQVAAHGGFSLHLACEGDLEIDPHHTVEDCSLAFGAALRQALGDRAGIGRYGFTAPMDEAEAAVSLDLSGRPYSVFDGTFSAERIGDYPTALTAHVFRSLADSLGAAVHVRVTGQDDHHKTEVCFKALGRALRQAVRIEGGGVPSTKGVIA